MQADKFLLIGNDKKMRSCKNRLAERGYDALCCESDRVRGNLSLFPNIVLPLPTLANGKISGTGITVDEFNGFLNENQKIFYGNLKSNPFYGKAFSYYNESFLVKNSRLTAQGTLRIILENIDRDMHMLNIAVLGYGRCGRAICKLLKANGAKTVSFSRSAYSFASAEDDGLVAESFDRLYDRIHQFDVVVNTVPHNILGKRETERLTSDNLYVEIASKPYGFDINETDKYNFRYILAESLPGRFTPVSAGANIADTIIEITEEGKNE